jgi:nucleoside-diphosphate-sugar epimerase
VAASPVVVTGANGRLGALLRRAWALEPAAGLMPVWAGRGPDADLRWDILADPPPSLPEGAIVLHLAAVLRGDTAALGQNAAMAAPVMAAARQSGAAAVLVASTAAVYAPTAVPARETVDPAPTAPYGRAKLAAEVAFQAETGPRPVVLRIGNVVGADALLGPRTDGGPVVLDPVPGRDGGPLRSWIGPVTLARVLAALCRMACEDRLPSLLNLATAPPLPMADLLDAAGRAWRYGPPNPAVVPAAVLSAERLAALYPLPEARAGGLVAELARLRVSA